MGFDPETTTSMLKPVGKDSSLKTWQGDQWQIGGGTTWGWFSYDPDLNLFYYGSGNPSTWNPVQRPGDNKWSNALFSRDLETGKANWVYQMTPHDEWGYDGANEVILVDQNINDKMRKTAVHFDANGFAYMMDRTSGELLGGDRFDTYYVSGPWRTRTWSNGVNLTTGLHDRIIKYSTDTNGVDVITKGICPSFIGAKGQAPAAYSHSTGLFYIPKNNICMGYEPFEVKYIKGQPYVGTTVNLELEDTYLGSFIAWNAREGKTVWSFTEKFSVGSGALVTAGDLVFYGTLEGYIKALDAHSGRELWSFKTPSGIVGNVNNYQHDGKQYISILSGIGGWARTSNSILSNEKMKRALKDWDESSSLGSWGSFIQSPSWTNLGGVLSTFTLPDKPLK